VIQQGEQTSVSHSASLNSLGLLACMKKVCRREKLAGLHIRVFFQMSLKPLSLLMTASQSSLHGMTQTVVGIQSLGIRYEEDT